MSPQGAGKHLLQILEMAATCLEEDADKLHCSRHVPACLLEGESKHCRADVGQLPLDAGHTPFFLLLLQLFSVLLHLQSGNIHAIETRPEDNMLSC